MHATQPSNPKPTEAKPRQRQRFTIQSIQRYARLAAGCTIAEVTEAARRDGIALSARRLSLLERDPRIAREGELAAIEAVIAKLVAERDGSDGAA